MRKSIVCSIVVLLAVTLLFAGCGGKKDESGQSTSTSGLSAKEILEESSNKMQTVKSARAEGQYKMSTSAADASSGAEAMDFSFEMEMDLSNEEQPELRMAMKGMGQDTILYMTGGYVYMEVPGQGWMKAPAGDTDSMTQTSPAEIAKFAENAENLKVVSETGTSYKISFDIGQALLKEQMGSQQDMGELSPEMQKMLDDMLKNMKMSAVFTINKKTMFIEDANIKMTLTDFPMVGDMALDMTMAFSDFNEPVSVSLPPEAANAQEVAEIPSASGFPGFPGLGL